eukprot:287547-Prymnesium_polylepis.1
MDGAPSGQAEQFPLTSVSENDPSVERLGIEPRTFAWPMAYGEPCGGSERYARSAVPLARGRRR